MPRLGDGAEQLDRETVGPRHERSSGEQGHAIQALLRDQTHRGRRGKAGERRLAQTLSMDATDRALEVRGHECASELCVGRRNGAGGASREHGEREIVAAGRPREARPRMAWGRTNPYTPCLETRPRARGSRPHEKQDCDLLAGRRAREAQPARDAQHRGGDRRSSSARSRSSGRAPYRVEGFLSKPHQAIEKLGPIDDPMIGVCVHWFYAPHTTDGVVGKDNPLLLASNFSGRLAGPGRPAQHRRLAREPGPHVLARVDRRRRLDRRRHVHGAAGRVVLHRPDRATARTRSPTTLRSPPAAAQLAPERRRRDSQRRAFSILMLGDTSMGMINGYFGPRLLNRHGFTEHKVDQAWIIDRGRRIEEKRIDAGASRSSRDKGVTFHWGESGRDRLRRSARRASSSATTWRCSTWSASSRPTAWAGSTSSGSSRCARRPISPRACSTRHVSPRVERRHHRHRHRGRPGQRHADGADEAPAQEEGAAPGGDVPRRALGRRARGALPLGAAQLGLVRRLRLQPRSRHAEGRALLPPALALLPHARRHLRRREPARQDDLGARVHPRRRAVDGHRPGRGGEAAARRCATRGGRGRRASGRSWPPTWASHATR